MVCAREGKKAGGTLPVSVDGQSRKDEYLISSEAEEKKCADKPGKYAGGGTGKVKEGWACMKRKVLDGKSSTQAMERCNSKNRRGKHLPGQEGKLVWGSNDLSGKSK